MEMQLTLDDVELILTEVQHFCQRTIHPLVDRPERSLAAGELADVTAQAAEIGLVNFSNEPGAGLWENVESCPGVALCSAALYMIAQTSVGIAYHFHQLALGSFAARGLGLSSGARAIVCTQGTYGLGRRSLARLLKGKELDAEDVLLLEDYFGSSNCQSESLPLLFQASEDWQELFAPSFDRAGGLGWAVYDREGLSVESLPHSHGLNETLTWQWRTEGASPRQVFPADAASVVLLSRILNLNAQALVAIALGGLQQAHAKAVEYAAIRVQGGKPINQHVAVQRLLATCCSTIGTVDLLRRQLAELPLESDSLAAVFSVRAQAHPLICGAANAVLQSFGGSGYMQETGLEKVVRDCNHLRQLCGTPSELLLFLAEWEGGK